MTKPSLTTSRLKYYKTIKSLSLCWLKKGHASHHGVTTPTKGGNALVGVDTYQRSESAFYKHLAYSQGGKSDDKTFPDNFKIEIL